MRKVFVGLLLILVVAIALGVHAYSSLDVASANVASVRPAFKSDVGSVLRAGAAASTGNLLLVSVSLAQAVLSLIDEVELSIQLGVKNNGFVPVYLTALRHEIYMTDVQVSDPSMSKGVWLGPKSTTRVGSIVVPFKRLPKAGLAVLTSGGTMEIEVVSTMELGPFRIWTRRTPVLHLSAAETIESRVKSIIGLIKRTPVFRVSVAETIESRVKSILGR